MILVLYAHPYPARSRGTAALLHAVEDLPGLAVRSLYDLYPDFDIDARAEQVALRAADHVVWMHPLYWYGPPALLKQWFEKVLVDGFAYGERQALRGKGCLWVTTTGGGEYARGGRHDHAFADFVPPVEMTARYCGMRWLEPFVVHDPAHRPDEDLRAQGLRLRERLAALGQGTGR